MKTRSLRPNLRQHTPFWVNEHVLQKLCFITPSAIIYQHTMFEKIVTAEALNNFVTLRQCFYLFQRISGLCIASKLIALILHFLWNALAITVYGRCCLQVFYRVTVLKILKKTLWSSPVPKTDYKDVFFWKLPSSQEERFKEHFQVIFIFRK